MTTARARPIIPRRHCYTLGGRYELASILITGSCEDITSRDPPNGLQATPPRGPLLITVGGSTHSHPPPCSSTSDLAPTRTSPIPS